MAVADSIAPGAAAHSAKLTEVRARARSHLLRQGFCMTSGIAGLSPFAVSAKRQRRRGAHPPPGRRGARVGRTPSSLIGSMSSARREKRARAADHFTAIADTLDRVASQLAEGIYPYGECQQMEQHAIELPDRISPPIECARPRHETQSRTTRRLCPARSAAIYTSPAPPLRCRPSSPAGTRSTPESSRSKRTTGQTSSACTFACSEKRADVYRCRG
jgi:hypothetical protein